MSWRAKYTVVEFKGQGGCGTVYVARDRAGELVALKVLNDAADDFVRALFVEAVKLYDMLGAPGVIRLLDHDLQCGEPYIVLELAERSLRERLGGQPQPPKLAAAIGLQIVCAVRQAHARGVLHFDIKPENILLFGGILKLCDFGLAKGLSSVLLTMGARGTPGYMAPEQCLGILTPAADIYGVGATLFEVLTGQRPPTNQANLDPRWHVRCPADLAVLVQTMTAAIPEHRAPFESAEAFLRAYIEPAPALPLREVARRAPVHARPDAGGQVLLGGFVLAALTLLLGRSKRQ